jgi:PAS domain S-box-containing protein
MSKLDLKTWVNENLFNVVPVAIAVIDNDFNLVYANNFFEKMFGTWEGKKCYSVYKNRNSMCLHCKGAGAFKDGKPSISEEIGFNKSGELTKYIKHNVPIVDENGEVTFLIEMATDITETEKIKKENQLLFDQVPCSILVIDKDFKIVRTNAKVREIFGDLSGKYCYETLKGFDAKCAECTASQTFKDGKMHTGIHVWKGKEGQDIYSQVSTVPLLIEDGKFDMVMEMAVDITHTLELEGELDKAYSFMKAMIETSIDGIVAIDDENNVRIFNKAARQLFKIKTGGNFGLEVLQTMLPEGFMNQVLAGPGHVYLPEADVTDIDGEKLPVRIAGNRIDFKGKNPGVAFYIQDLRELKNLEKQKLEAERLAAVGQTVAGLAHGVKNLLTGLEGGMYIMNSGMKKGNVSRIQNGLEMLDRNIARVSTFVKEFLNFSKGRQIKVANCLPAKIAEDVVELYSRRASEHNIKLECKNDHSMKSAMLDSDGIHECITNLVGNAIDACRMSEDVGETHVLVRTYEENETIVFEVVDDGCGMEYEIKKKVFTNFFTTKGLGGTGIGLLRTKKIVQEHGGSVELESEPGKGSTFKILLPRKRLPMPSEDGKQ